MKPNLLLLTFIFYQILPAQNLVKSPSFENLLGKPGNRGQFNSHVIHWETPNLGTTDLFNKDSNRVGYKNEFGYQEAHHGTSYAGIYVYSYDNYREYIQGNLIDSLNTGQDYTITFWISKAEKATHSIKDFHILFSEKSIKRRDDYVISQRKNDKEKTELHQFKIDSFMTNEKTWVKLSQNIKASGFEKSFIIGNFTANKTIELLGKKTKSKKAFAYYYIDAISIKPLNPIIKEITILEPEKIYTFKNVLFDFDKAVLLDQSIEELDKLGAHLKTHPELSIEIYGHTDNVGLKSRNKELSQQRATAVSKYLIEKGLDKNHIKSFGFGAEQPVVENNTDKNRSLNRRVNFKLIEL